MHSGFIRDGLAAWAGRQGPFTLVCQARDGWSPGPSPAPRVTSTIPCREQGGRGAALGGKTSFNYDPLPPNMCIIL